MNEREALTAIGKLCEHPDHDLYLSAEQVRAILTQTQPGAVPSHIGRGGLIDALTDWLETDYCYEQGSDGRADQEWVEGVADAILARVG